MARRVQLVVEFHADPELPDGLAQELCDDVIDAANAFGYVSDVRWLPDDRAEEWLYRKCAYCHLFVEPNPAFGDAPWVAAWTHLHRGDGADEELDASHEPVPAGGAAFPLSWWRVHGPAEMRARFTEEEG